MKKLILMLAATTALAACSQADDAEEAAATADPGATGAVIVEMPDGTKVLNVSTASGETWGAPIESEPGAWSVEGDKACIDPAGEDEKFCFTSSAVAEDGTFVDTNDDGTTATIRRLDKTLLAGEVPVAEAGSYHVTFADGTTGLSVWTADGKSYFAPSPEHGTFHVVDGKRCGKRDSQEEESCGIPGPVAEDGSFTATQEGGDGSTITVRPIG